MHSGGSVTQITLVTGDLAESVSFYGDALQAEELYQDEGWAVFRLGGMLVFLLVEREAVALLGPGSSGERGAPRGMVTLEVDDVDRTAADLTAAGVTLLSGPLTRPWGPRTATFADPDGHVWEIAQAQ